MDGGGADAGPTEILIAALQDDGFIVQEGAFAAQDLSSCCDVGQSCFGNNPASPYAAFRVPPGPDQKAPNPMQKESDESVVFRLRSDEALVYLGRTPPRARYFGYTPYLFDRDDGTGQRLTISASLSETLNDRVIAVGDADDVYDQAVAIIATADEGVDGRVRAALAATGLPESAMNTLVFDPTVSRFGLEDDADAFSVVFRVAFFDDPEAGAAFLKDPPGELLRVTPDPESAEQLFGRPPTRTKDAVTTELALEGAVDALEAALIAADPTHVATVVPVVDITPSPDACIDQQANCYFDNRDTIYPAMNPEVLFDGTDVSYIMYGVNHEATGKATYASGTVHGLVHFVGVETATSVEYTGSAEDELPSHPDRSVLYAWKFARDCGSDPHCTPILDAACPTGVATAAPGLIMFRTYLEPSTNTAPDPSTLVQERILRFAP